MCVRTVVPYPPFQMSVYVVISLHTHSSPLPSITRYGLIHGRFVVTPPTSPTPTSTQPHTVVLDQTTSRGHQYVSDGHFLDTTLGTPSWNQPERSDVTFTHRSDLGVLSGGLSPRESNLTWVVYPFWWDEIGPDCQRVFDFGGPPRTVRNHIPIGTGTR